MQAKLLQLMSSLSQIYSEFSFIRHLWYLPRGGGKEGKIPTYVSLIDWFLQISPFTDLSEFIYIQIKRAPLLTLYKRMSLFYLSPMDWQDILMSPVFPLPIWVQLTALRSELSSPQLHLRQESSFSWQKKIESSTQENEKSFILYSNFWSLEAASLWWC